MKMMVTQAPPHTLLTPTAPCQGEDLGVVTFIGVIFSVVLLAACALGFNHQLQEIYPALRGKAGVSLVTGSLSSDKQTSQPMHDF